MSDPQPMISLEDITPSAIETEVETFSDKWSLHFMAGPTREFRSDLKRLVALAMLSGTYFNDEAEPSHVGTDPQVAESDPPKIPRPDSDIGGTP